MWLIYCEGQCIGQYASRDLALRTMRAVRAQCPYCQYRIRQASAPAPKPTYGRI